MLRVTHCPVNTAGIPWTNVQALRRRDVDARLVVFNRYTLHPEADVDLGRSGGLLRQQATQWRAFARLAPQTDVFHFYFGLTLVPKSLQFRALRMLGKKSVMHFLGSDIRGKPPEQLDWSRRAGARVVGSYDAIRWVPDAVVIPPGIDLSGIEASPPSDRERPVVLHAPSSRRRKGTEHVVDACEQLDVELEIVEGLDHREAFERYRNADVVVDQLNAGWYGVFAIEAMALGKPVVTFLHDEAVTRTEEAFGLEVPLVRATKETLADALRPLVESPEERRRVGAASRAYVERVHDADAVAARLVDLYAGLHERARMRLGHELRRLGRHTAVYGLGGMVSRVLAVLLLPLYTHYLPKSAYGKVEIVTAATAVLAILLQLGVASAFFRFYFDAKTEPQKLTVVRTSFWFTMGSATLGLLLGVIFAVPIAHVLGLGSSSNLVIAGAVGLWAQTNYQQLTALFRVEERSVAFAIASIANVLLTILLTVLFIVVLHWGAIGLIVGNFTGTLCVYLVLLAYRHEQLGLEFDRKLFRGMQKFGMPLVPSALALWAINFIDREFIIWYKGAGEVGVYSVAIKVASIITFIMVAFRTAWPAFAYSIEDDREARRTYSFVLTYLLSFASWAALALGALAPWWVALLTNPRFQRAQEAVALLAFAFAIYAGYTVLAIGSGRARRTQFNWVVTGVGAAVNVGLNFWLIPRWGMVGAAISTLVSYVVLFVGMTIYAQHVYRVPYQWRRVVTAVGTGVGLTVAARAAHLPFAPSVVLVAVYPLVLLGLGFYLPAERARLLRRVPSFR